MTDLMQIVETAIATLPSEAGGIAIVLATASSPPAVAVLSSGDVHLVDGEARVGIHASSSAVRRLAGGFTLLVPLSEIAARVEVADATAEVHGDLALLCGSVVEVRPTAEPPWALEMTFRPEGPDLDSVTEHLDYWRGVKAWLSGASPVPPPLPQLR